MKSKPNTYFLFIFILWYIMEIIFSTTVKSICGIPAGLLSRAENYLVLLLLSIWIIFFQTYHKKEYLVIAAISVPFLMTAAVSRNYSLLSGWMFVIAAKDADLDKTIKEVYKVLCIAIPLVILLYFGNVLENHAMVREDAMRYSLGFSHPNQLGARLFQLVACHFYIHRDKLRVMDYGIAAIIALFVYFVPNSQSSCMCILFLMLFLLIYNGCQKYKEGMLCLYEKALVLFAAFINGISILLSFIGVKQSQILSQIDLWMSSRFSQGHKTLQLYGMSLWGQKVYLYEEDRVRAGMAAEGGRIYLDNAYLSLLIRYGILSYVIFSAAYLFLMNDCRNCRGKKQHFLLIALFVYALYGVMENGMFMLSHNVFLIAFAGMLYEKCGRKNER